VAAVAVAAMAAGQESTVVVEAMTMSVAVEEK
jgi:hypothetical protein